ncbi:MULTISPECIES: lipopolysaccharide assembly protein LapB [Bacillales]|jgi:hypothetical protein|uniref:tetratricopeptide repeat protein n=1 Tax=Brevibacillus TaxID=55080 RepID=UPI00149325B8|nr:MULTISPECIES: hypothetical protein [Bacillales]MBR8661253.1 hypothetical protein [Brevibacillus sp. NL20B1]MDT3415153.1 putative Zn-dependent protease [Brevibacillus aydinogluensis]NNV01693.1 hypothetical protein [Brevibacillus sp. MCWH]UFJ60932.1 hypothetical protein IRT44_17035 [Anoxybacillus sediminis]
MDFGAILGKLGPLFFSFLMPKIKNSKLIRDLQAKWVKDNYAKKTTLMFEAALADAKATFDLPDELIRDLIEDRTNREEMFRWILEGVPYEKFTREQLNLEPYMEAYPSYQDFIVPFFQTILLKLEEYKVTQWEPEFLQILNRINYFEDEIKEGFKNIEQNQIKTIQITEENNRLLKQALTPVGFEDLSKLIKQGKTNVAREKAEERLKRSLKQEEYLELHSIIATSYIVSGKENEAIPHLYAAVANSNDEARKKRLLALIHIFENQLDKALSNIREAIDIEGKTTKNLEILINIFLQQKKYDEALKILLENPDSDLDQIKAHVLLNTKKYDQVTELSDYYLNNEPNNINWLLIKIESKILKMENDISNNVFVDPEKILLEVMPVLDHLEKQDIDNIGILTRIKELKSALYFRNKRFSEAKILYEEVYRDKGNINNLISCCIFDGDWDRAIDLLQEKISVETPNLNDLITLSQVYVEAGRPNDALALLEANKSLVETELKIPLKYYFTYMDALFLNVNHSEIKNLIEVLNLTTSDREGIYALKAYYAMKLHDWEEAVTNWESCIDQLDGQVVIECKIQLSIAYLNRGTEADLKKLKELIVSIPNWMQHEILVNRYVRALFQLGEYKQILSLIDQLTEKSDFLLNVVTTIYFNLGWYEVAKVNFLNLYQKTQELHYLLRYADCLFRLGNANHCLEVLESAENRVKKSGSMEDFNLLSIAFMNALKYQKSMEYAYQTYLAGKENPNAWRFFFWQMAHLGQFIADPEKEWLEAYSEVATQFNKKFPDEEPLFKEFKAIEEGKISNQFIEELKKSTESILHVKTVFERYKLPLSFLINALNKGPFETWGHVMNERDMRIWMLQGDQRELLRGAEAAKHAKEVLCDVTTLLTIRHLGLLDKLKERYDLYIHQEHFDLVFQEYLNTKLISDDGLKTLSYENDRLVLREFSSELVKESVKNQEEFIEWLNENCKKVGNVIENDFDNKNDKIAFLNHPIRVSKNRSFTMLVDSFVTGCYARESHGVNYFTTFDVLEVFILEGVIDNDKWSECIGKLVMMGYALIPVNEKVFTYYLKKNNFKMNEQVIALFDYLKQEEFSEDFLINLVATILGWIWIESISPITRQQLTDYLCHVLTFKRNKLIIIEKLIDQTTTKFSPLVVLQRQKMKRCIEQWLKSQSII